jgi:nucleotide-binding universal stress UspA family protein
MLQRKELLRRFRVKIIMLYDGSLHAKSALQYGIDKASETGGELVVLSVFHRDLFIDYEGGLMAQDAARAENERHLLEVKNMISESRSPASIRVIEEEGDPEKELLRLAASERSDLLLATPRYRNIAKKSPCPVYVIPGTIMIPVDNTDALMGKVDEIVKEARRTASNVLVLGVVPIHLYGIEEKQELELVRKNTSRSMQKMREALSAQGIEAREEIRSGFPYEEILKAADEFSVSLIMLPTGGTTPSELTKAAAILLDEPAGLKRPVYLMHTADAF